MSALGSRSGNNYYQSGMGNSAWDAVVVVHHVGPLQSSVYVWGQSLQKCQRLFVSSTLANAPLRMSSLPSMDGQAG